MKTYKIVLFVFSLLISAYNIDAKPRKDCDCPKTKTSFVNKREFRKIAKETKKRQHKLNRTHKH